MDILMNFQTFSICQWRNQEFPMERSVGRGRGGTPAAEDHWGSGGSEAFSRWRLGFRYSFICQGTSTRSQRSDLCGLRVELLLTTSLTTQR